MGGLLLKRKLGQRIMIGDDVVIEVILCERGATKLRILAPDSVRVDREEVFLERKRREAVK